MYITATLAVEKLSVNWSISATERLGRERYAKKNTEVKITKTILTAR